MAILKKQTFGSISAMLALVLALVGVIAYFVNIAGAGYFQNADVPTAALYGILAVVALAAVVVLAQLNLSGIVEKIVEVLSGLLRIAAPAALMGAAMMLVDARAQGLAYIYFSNEEVLAEVQTAANLSSATGAIVAIAVLAVAAIVGVVSAFFKVKK